MNMFVFVPDFDIRVTLVPRSDEVLFGYFLEGPPFESKELLLHHTIFIQQSDCKLFKTESKNSSK